jgi:hypothetical protein
VKSLAPLSSSELSKAAAPGESKATPQASPVDGPSPFAQLVRGLGHEIKSGETMLHAAEASLVSGSEMSPGQLIALQVGVYRYTDAVDLASRLVDRATNGIKTVIQGGGQ